MSFYIILYNLGNYFVGIMHICSVLISMSKIIIKIIGIAFLLFSHMVLLSI